MVVAFGIVTIWLVGFGCCVTGAYWYCLVVGWGLGWLLCVGHGLRIDYMLFSCLGIL